MAAAQMRDALLREKERLEGLLESLERDWNNAPKITVLCLLGTPVGIAAGAAWGVLVAALVLSLVATVLYLVGVRRKEYRHELDEVVKQLTAAGDGP